nr:hypothetical protein [Cryobacterium sp. TMT1-21]
MGALDVVRAVRCPPTTGTEDVLEAGSAAGVAAAGAAALGASAAAAVSAVSAPAAGAPVAAAAPFAVWW